MNPADDQLFRLILLAGFAILLPIGVYHRVKSRTGEKLDRQQEGLFILVALRVAGITGMLGVVAYLINPAWLAWAAMPLPNWLRWTGAGFGVIGELLFVWTLRNLGKNLTDTVVTRQHHTLVTTGPYRWIRHPFYTSAALMIPASFLLAANWFFLAIGVTVFRLLAIRTRKEEEHLIARFGDDYRNYMQRTGRFLPRL
jgi:protein-S-isoprenylcysteine O-methyltransferase Ste14